MEGLNKVADLKIGDREQDSDRIGGNSGREATTENRTWVGEPGVAEDKVGILYCEQLKFTIVKFLKMKVK